MDLVEAWGEVLAGKGLAREVRSDLACQARAHRELLRQVMVEGKHFK
jgi:hypothetical protein